jgi:hypothetical protein
MPNDGAATSAGGGRIQGDHRRHPNELHCKSRRRAKGCEAEPTGGRAPADRPPCLGSQDVAEGLSGKNISNRKVLEQFRLPLKLLGRFGAGKVTANSSGLLRVLIPSIGSGDPPTPGGYPKRDDESPVAISTGPSKMIVGAPDCAIRPVIGGYGQALRSSRRPNVRYGWKADMPAPVL